MSEDSARIYSSSLGFTFVIYTGISLCPFGNHWQDEGVKVRMSKLMSSLGALKKGVSRVGFIGMRMGQLEIRMAVLGQAKIHLDHSIFLIATGKKYFKTNTKLSSH